MISVIIPVYNVQDYLAQCVDSVINQTYKDLEIILVDDGSTDKSSEMCDSYAEKDKRIKVIHKKNGGLSSARNAGLKIAEGEYILYVDSDDYVSTEIADRLLKVAAENDSDIVKCNNIRFKNAVEHNDCSDDTGAIRCFNGEEAILNMLNETYSRKKAFPVTVWATLYKHEIIKGIEFPEGLLYEDGYYTPQAILRADKLAHIDETFYFYRENANSIMSGGITEKSLKSIDDWEFIHNCILKKYPEHAHYAAAKWANKLLITYDKLLKSPEIDIDGKYKKHIIEKINQNYSYFMSSMTDENMKFKLKLLKKNPEKYEQKKDKQRLSVKGLIKKVIS